jgi:DNA polymerase III epsilon subunit-like protein
MVKDAPRFGEVAFSVLDFLQDSVIVAHNASFDLGFLSKQLTDLRLPIPKNLALCTLTLARRCFRFPHYNLGFIAEIFGLKTEVRHRAMADVELTKGIFHFFLQHFRESGLTSLEELLELQGGSIPFLTIRGIVLPPALDEVLQTQGALKIRYISLHGEETSRIIEPIEVITNWDYIYLVAFCHLRKEKRTFRLDRILEMEPIM